ncbi:MAG: hypothetical protein ACKO47_06035 [Alphaproteobacteria bacterium]
MTSNNKLIFKFLEGFNSSAYSNDGFFLVVLTAMTGLLVVLTATTGFF